jgi:hypothetical protein
MVEVVVQLFDWDSYSRRDATAAKPTSGHLRKNCYADLSAHEISAFCSAIRSLCSYLSGESCLGFG